MNLTEKQLAYFWSKVEKTNTCWLWRGHIDPQGYGAINFTSVRKTSPSSAHRLSFILSGKSIPDGMTLDHLCRVRHCVNPSHLEVVTRGENVLRGVGASAKNKAKTHCPNGHPYDITFSNGLRDCRICKNERLRRRYNRSHESMNDGRRNTYASLTDAQRSEIYQKQKARRATRAAIAAAEKEGV